MKETCIFSQEVSQEKQKINIKILSAFLFNVDLLNTNMRFCSRKTK